MDKQVNNQITILLFLLFLARSRFICYFGENGHCKINTVLWLLCSYHKTFSIPVGVISWRLITPFEFHELTLSVAARIGASLLGLIWTPPHTCQKQIHLERMTVPVIGVRGIRNLENGTDLPNRCAKMGQKAHGAPQNKCQWQDAASIDVFLAKNITFCFFGPVQPRQIQVCDILFNFWHNLVIFCVLNCFKSIFCFFARC